MIPEDGWQRPRQLVESLKHEYEPSDFVRMRVWYRGQSEPESIAHSYQVRVLISCAKEAERFGQLWRVEDDEKIPGPIGTLDIPVAAFAF